MASFSNLRSEDQFLCSICLDMFSDPVSIPCGHNFCLACITQYWDSSAVCLCPMCMERFCKRPELRVNTGFRDVVDKIKKIRLTENSALEPGEIPCDICTKTKLTALKSCLVCQTSYCESHLEPHHIAVALKKHKLVDPVENLEEWLCKKHNRPLELFCKTDNIGVCQICPQTDHRFHYTVNLEDECEERKVLLRMKKTCIEQLIQQRLAKVQEIKQSVETSKRDAEREISDSVEVFTALVRSIERGHAGLIELITEKHKAAERQAKKTINELQEEISKLKRRSVKLEELLGTEDYVHIFKSFPTVVAPPQTKDWSEVSINSDLSVGTVRRAVSQLEDSLMVEVKKLCKAELQRIQQYAVDVTLDPDTANPHLIVSQDRKQVRAGQPRKGLPDIPSRFDRGANVLGEQGFSRKFYFEVRVEGKTDWDIGVALGSVQRKGMILLDPLNGYWCVALRERHGYVACTATTLHLSLREKPQKVGVFVDYEEGQVSFYDVEAESHIYSYTGCTFTEKLFLFLSPSLNKGGKNSGPLVITPVSR